MQPVYVVSKPVPIALALMLCATWLFGQNRSLAPTGKDFPFAGGNLGTQRYSVLTQNDQSNVNKLGGAWMGVHVGGGGIVVHRDCYGFGRHYVEVQPRDLFVFG
jgi:hypothetical protein